MKPTTTKFCLLCNQELEPRHMCKCPEHNKPTTFESEIEDILLEVERDFGMSGLSFGLYGDYATEVAKKYFAKIQTTIRESLPEKFNKEHEKYINKDNPDKNSLWHSIGWNSGYNQAIDTITAKLKENGLL